MLLSSFFKHKRDANEVEGPTVQFTAAEHTINRTQAAQDKAMMTAEITVDCVNTSFHLPLRDEPSIHRPDLSVDPLAIIPSESASLAPPNAFGPVQERAVPLREIVDVDAVPPLAHLLPLASHLLALRCQLPRRRDPVASRSVIPQLSPHCQRSRERHRANRSNERRKLA